MRRALVVAAAVLLTACAAPAEGPADKFDAAATTGDAVWESLDKDQREFFCWAVDNAPKRLETTTSKALGIPRDETRRVLGYIYGAHCAS